RAVDQARGQDLLLRGPALPLEEAARNLPGGECFLLVVDGEREEIDPLPRFLGCDRGHQHHRVAVAHEGRAACLLGEASDLDRELPSVEVDLNCLHQKLLSLRLRASSSTATPSPVLSKRKEGDWCSPSPEAATCEGRAARSGSC